MTETHMLSIVLALCAGLVLGFLFFGGLWLTTRRLPSSARPYRLMLVSFAVRLTLLIAGLYWATGGDPVLVISSMIGLLAARTVAVRWCSPGRPALTT